MPTAQLPSYLRPEAQHALQLRAYASVPTPDLSGDIVEPMGIKPRPHGVPLLLEHNPSQRIAQRIDLHISPKGLLITAPLNQAAAATIRSRFRQNLPIGLSIGFQTQDFVPREPKGRILRSILLWEVSLVSAPMHRECLLTPDNLMEA